MGAVETRVEIHRIRERGDSRRRAERAQIALCDIEQRPQMPAAAPRPAHRHGAQSLQSGTAQQLQQDGLGLVLRVVRRQQAFPDPEFASQSQIPCIARRLFDRRAVGRHDGHRDHGERHAEPPAQRLAGLTQADRRRLQRVVDMNGAQRQITKSRQPRLRQRRQQARGIRTAADGHDQTGRRRRQMGLDHGVERDRREAHGVLRRSRSYGSRNTPKLRRRACRASSKVVTG